MLLGLVRGGPAGAFLAWLGFTAPSAIAMALIAAGLGAASREQPSWLPGLLAGLFSAAGAVVAQAVIGLARALCTDAPTRTIAIGAAGVALALRPWPGLQWAPIALGAVTGALWLGDATQHAGGLPIRIPRAAAVVAGALFAGLIALTLLPKGPATELVATVVRAGSLVFGGGHVVLPLLQGLVREGLIGERVFFAGYGAVQAMPGPLFSFSSFLGFANASPLHGPLGALACLALIYLPSFALIFALAPAWNLIVGAPHASAALRGANAAVVGLLGAVLYDPIVLSLGGASTRVAIALAAFAAIGVWRVPPWIVVVCAAAAGVLLHA